jgi:hypothetical protein
MEKSVQITMIIVGAIVLLALLGGFMFYNLIPAELRGTTVNVNGISTIKATPDVVKVYFNMETNASTSSEATSLNAEQVDEMITSLVKLGLERNQIQTQNFNVYQWQEWENDEYVDKGYKASHQIIVELSTNQFSLVGSVIDAGTEAEAMISYINFELSQAKQNEYKAEAFKQASQDARIKAESIASGLGKQVGDVISVSTQDWNYSPWPLYSNRGGIMMAEAASAKDATTNISPSTQEVTGQVSVVYALK